MVLAQGNCLPSLNTSALYSDYGLKCSLSGKVRVRAESWGYSIPECIDFRQRPDLQNSGHLQGLDPYS